MACRASLPGNLPGEGDRHAGPATCRTGNVEHVRHPRVDQDLPDPAASRARQGQLAPAGRDPRALPRPVRLYVAGELADGEQMPLMRLRYGGSAHRWGTAIYVASKDSYEDQIWFSGSIEEIFDLVRDLHVTNAGH